MATAEPGPQSPAASVAASMLDGKAHLLLAASGRCLSQILHDDFPVSKPPAVLYAGSVAAIKLPLIINALAKHANLSIRIVLTNNAARFLDGQSPEQPAAATLAHMPNVDAVYLGAEDEWAQPWSRGSAILHIELRRWSHLLVICPLSANLLAKITNGLCDDLLTNTIRAWAAGGAVDGGPHGGKKTILVAPAMNTAMWEHPITARQVHVLEHDWGVGIGDTGWFEVLRPQEKALACGDVGIGAMMDWEVIVGAIETRLGLS